MLAHIHELVSGLRWRHFIKNKSGGQGGERWTVSNQSGDRDFVIHGSVTFLGACQKAVIEGKNQVLLI